MSVVANVAINVDSRNAASKLREFQTRSEAAERAASKIGPSASKSFNSASSSLNNLVTGIGRLAAAYATLQVAQQAAQSGIQREESTRRLTFLAQGYGEVARAQELAIESGKKFGLSITESNQQFSQLYGRLRALNVPLEDINAAFVGFNTAAKVSGSTTAETAGALLQLTQALGSGVLRGQELNSVLEQAPGLVVALTKELGVPISEIRKLAEEGKITSDVVIRALKRAGTEGADELAAAMNGPAQEVKNLQNEFQNLQVAVTTGVMPQIIAILKETTRVVGEGSTFVENLGLAFQYAANQLAPFLNGLSQLQWYFTNLTPPGWAMQVIGGSTGMGRNIIAEGARRQRSAGGYTSRFAGARDAAFARAQMITGAPKPSAAPSAPKGTSGTSTNKAADEAKRLAEQMRQQLKAADDINFALKNRLEIAQTTEPVAKRMLEYDIKQNEIAKEYDELKKAAKGADELALINANLIIENRIAQVEYEQQINDLLAERATLMADVMREAGMPTVYNELETQDAALKSILEKYPAIGAAADAAATLATSGMASMIAGTKSAQQVFVEFLDSIANALMQTAAKMIAQYIALGIARMFAGMGGGPGNFAPSGALPAVGDVGTGFNFDVGAMLPGRAKGGPVSSGQMYMVGERGPELFVPGRSGTIVANDKMGGGSTNVIVNVDAKGSSVEGNEQGANQLGRVISAAVQSELIKQQRPGGLLAR